MAFRIGEIWNGNRVEPGFRGVATIARRWKTSLASWNGLSGNHGLAGITRC